MKNNRLHTPDGVRDIYGDDCEKKIILERKLTSVLRTYGYHPIQTPSFEYFDVFNQEYGSVSSRAMYKFFDREGNTMVLRPDITPSIARCAATYFTEDPIPLRFCYTGNTFINNHSYQGRLTERTQTGAELVGADSVDADAEMIALSIRLLMSSGLKNFQISIGHVDYLGGLFEASGIDAEKEEEIRNLILNRNFYGVEDNIRDLSIDRNLKYLFSLLKEVVLSETLMRDALTASENYPRIRGALVRLKDLMEILEYYGVSRYVSYELALISGMNYYTGIIYAGYTYGSGEAIVNGGRYDNLLNAFGKNAPATGFAIITDQLLAALQRQHIQVPVSRNTIWMLYSEDHRKEAIKEASDLRSSGERVELMLVTADRTREMYEDFARSHGVSDLIYKL